MSHDKVAWPSLPAGAVSPADETANLAASAPVHEEARDARGRFLTGNSGGGRRKGSRNRLTETFIAAIEIDFAEHGPDALAQLRGDDPATYLRIIASLIPRDLILKREQRPDYSELSISELEELLGRERANGSFSRALQQARHGY
ncbi:hypothetical protein H9L13_06805 [Sphingomonas lutea]|uniref:Uncharacterized protein n=1 Tax=Sphingomonas lutea TaxID=1045317 RepID=A0A7G9SF16_9SPHN|nr:hypothetical protein [Sphingomonas lutea]QNN66441.1 hypothetical protein H9L13_06805 [Sphingomonas lutea]